MVCIDQNRRDNKGVCKDGWYGGEPRGGFSEQVCAECADERCKRAEHDVLPQSACNKVRDHTSDGQPRDCGGEEHGHYAQRFRHAELDCSACEVECSDNAGEDGVKCGDDSRLADVQDVLSIGLCFHFRFFSLVLFYVRMVTNSQIG